MNAINSLARALAEQKFTDAVERASDWARVARPVIIAWYKLDDIRGELSSAAYEFRGDKKWNEPKAYDERAMRDASSDLAKPMDDLNATISGIRDDFICDEHNRATPAVWTEQAEDDFEEFCEALEREVPSVDAVMKRIGDEL